MCQHPLSGVSPYSGVLTNPTERYMLTQAPITGTVTGRLCSAVDRLKTITRKPTGLCSTELCASALARLTNPAEAPVPRQSGARPTAPGDAPRRGILGPFRPRAPGDRPGPTNVFFGKKHFFFSKPQKARQSAGKGAWWWGPQAGVKRASAFAIVRGSNFFLQVFRKRFIRNNNKTVPAASSFELIRGQLKRRRRP